MKIGIIVFSHTGHNLIVGEKIKDFFAAKGYDSVILRVTGENEDSYQGKPIVLRDKPETDPFDVILFGAPVWGFNLSPFMKEYMKQISSLKGKKVGCFVTQGLSKAWMGGNHTVKQLVSLCRSKGVDVNVTELIGWKDENLEKRIEAAAKNLSAIV